MIKLKNLLFEAGGEASGKLELVSTSLKDAREYTKKGFEKKGQDIDKEIPNFDVNYKNAQNRASLGKTKRKDMPVISDADVRDLQTRLSKGYIDINAPFSTKTNKNNPFPSGLSGKDAKKWLEDGLPTNDKADKSDDVVKVKRSSIKVNKLKPIQKQIYFDKSMNSTVKFGKESSLKFIKSSILITSSDNHIIDGHHRFLSALLLDPYLTVNTLAIDLPISKLLPLSLSYSDAIGNVRNA